MTPPVAGALLRAALVASCLRGALPPVDFLAVCLVRAILEIERQAEDFTMLQMTEKNKTDSELPADLQYLYRESAGHRLRIFEKRANTVGVVAAIDWSNLGIQAARMLIGRINCAGDSMIGLEVRCSPGL